MWDKSVFDVKIGKFNKIGGRYGKGKKLGMFGKE